MPLMEQRNLKNNLNNRKKALFFLMCECLLHFFVHQIALATAPGG